VDEDGDGEETAIAQPVQETVHLVLPARSCLGSHGLG
jgi:hypothetical protein